MNLWTVLGTLTTPGIITTVILLILRGKLVPGSTVKEMREDHKARILEAREVTDMWKQAYSTSERARMEDHPMIRESVENGRAILKLIESIREAGEEDHVAS